MSYERLLTLIDNAVDAQVREHNTGVSAERVCQKADSLARKLGYTLDWRPGLVPIIERTPSN